MSVDGVAMMTRWWNRMPQFDGLFDYQNTPRPAYFAFKLLSRCSGERLELTSSQANIKGFAAHDAKLRMYNIMLWNFSPKAAQAELSLLGLPGRCACAISRWMPNRAAAMKISVYALSPQ